MLKIYVLIVCLFSMYSQDFVIKPGVNYSHSWLAYEGGFPSVVTRKHKPSFSGEIKLGYTLWDQIIIYTGYGKREMGRLFHIDDPQINVDSEITLKYDVIPLSFEFFFDEFTSYYFSFGVEFGFLKDAESRNNAYLYEDNVLPSTFSSNIIKELEDFNLLYDIRFGYKFDVFSFSLGYTLGSTVVPKEGTFVLDALSQQLVEWIPFTTRELMLNFSYYLTF